MKTNYITLKGGEYEHRFYAIDAMGKNLPRKAVVHHVDGDPTNNKNSNLVVCQDQKYHYLLHIRENALKACGNKHWRKCVYCQQYDDSINMNFRSNGNHAHLKCESQNRSENRRKQNCKHSATRRQP